MHRWRMPLYGTLILTTIVGRSRPELSYYAKENCCMLHSTLISRKMLLDESVPDWNDPECS